VLVLVERRATSPLLPLSMFRRRALTLFMQQYGARPRC
jgi:hypothetical protein